jgi:glycogen synthase
LPFTGGTELHVHEVARRLAAGGATVRVLTTDPSGSLPRRESSDGVELVRVPAWPRKRDYYFAPGVVEQIRPGAWDIVHVQGYQTLVAPLAMIASRRSHLPYVLTFHGGGHSSGLREQLRPLQLAVLRPLLARATRLIAVASHEVEEYAGRLRLPEERFVVISNGSDLPREGTECVERQPLLIASLGRLERYKGHRRVLEALPSVLETHPDARLWIGGHGPDEAVLRETALRLGLAQRVDIRAIGIGERVELAHQLARVKVVVSMSEFETQPIAMLEALSLGCRLVVARSPGLEPLVDAGLARGVSPESTSAEISEAIAAELDQPAPVAPPVLPTWDDCAEALLRLYASIAER